MNDTVLSARATGELLIVDGEDSKLNILERSIDTVSLRRKVGIVFQKPKVIQLEARVDQQNRDVIKELEDLLRQDSTQVEPALHVFSAARNIEQVADHAENIAEEVIYMIDGEIIRHNHNQLVRRTNG